MAPPHKEPLSIALALKLYHLQGLAIKVVLNMSKYKWSFYDIRGLYDLPGLEKKKVRVKLHCST